MVPTPDDPAPTAAEMAEAAAGVLYANDAGSMTRASSGLYPHQWSWDAAFVAIGWAALDVERAMQELDSLLAGQWHDGMIPHIVFDPRADGYFPGPEVWDCASASDHAPTTPRTSGICQPPVHAIAAAKVFRAARAANETSERAIGWLHGILPRLHSWHRYLMRERCEAASGLITLFHGWESGTDNSPRWDAPYRRVGEVELAAGTRRDVAHVADAGQRPSDRDYRRYLALVERARACGYDARRLRATADFAVGDVLFTAILAAAAEALADLCAAVGVDARESRETAARCRAAVSARCDAVDGSARDLDLRTGRELDGDTIAGFAPLIAGGLAPAARARLLRRLLGSGWSGYPGLHHGLPPSTSPTSPRFDPRNYWRGPVWPVVNWLLTWALRRDGEPAVADLLVGRSLAQLGDLAFGEYYEPFTGEALGSRGQSWTAAVALDWLATSG